MGSGGGGVKSSLAMGEEDKAKFLSSLNHGFRAFFTGSKVKSSQNLYTLSEHGERHKTFNLG